MTSRSTATNSDVINFAKGLSTFSEKYSKLYTGETMGPVGETCISVRLEVAPWKADQISAGSKLVATYHKKKDPNNKVASVKVERGPPESLLGLGLEGLSGPHDQDVSGPLGG